MLAAMSQCHGTARSEDHSDWRAQLRCGAGRLSCHRCQQQQGALAGLWMELHGLCIAEAMRPALLVLPYVARGLKARKHFSPSVDGLCWPGR